MKCRLAAILASMILASGARAQQEFRQPGAPPVTPGTQGFDFTEPPGFLTVPVPDRNRIINTLGVPDNPLNPYRQSTLKGDRPLFGDWFVQLSAILDNFYEPKAVPVPVDVVATNRPYTGSQFGRPGQDVLSTTFLPTFAIIKGDTSFKPPDFEFRFTPAFNFTHVGTQELGLIDTDPSRGTNRDSRFFGVQEAFIDYHLWDVSPRYDFDAIRVGIQPINADFRGFLFLDQQLGIRLHGDRDNNRFQYNLAFFRRIEKDTNSGLNDLAQPLRRDEIFLANLFVQDLPVPGFTTEFSVVENRNRETEQYYDTDGFLTRPAAIGLENPHTYDVTYFGLNGDGHFGRFNLTQSFYFAAGNDSQNQISGNKARIRAFFAALEPSVDFDYVRLRGSFLYASGDNHPGSSTEGGFDAILENPQFAGADTSYWIRQAIPLIGGGGVNLVGRDGLLPDLRSSKDEGQSNFINPGLTLIGAGVDVDVLPEVRVSFNANHLSFNNTAILEILEQKSPIRRDIGWDISGAVTWRPFDTQNVVIRASSAFLLPGPGFRDLYASESKGQIFYSGLINVLLTY